jgi:hypothetical protein
VFTSVSPICDETVFSVLFYKIFKKKKEKRKVNKRAQEKVNNSKRRHTEQSLLHSHRRQLLQSEKTVSSVCDFPLTNQGAASSYVTAQIGSRAETEEY